ncbi:N-acetyltransferase [Bartonella sp. HY329]|uniref:GNAT family N-acetyltransferase n=1 Tax=unclassified Bartonella TaxID=2645622 RepID=UPI0021CA6DAF|nr:MULTISPECIES: N-acetyltransferase [unclassified Bartonella]UXM94550.1 N-acetyltransferase [Bartonella sp. HY329]UXN08874.1 N-acetyltransferase [Bartonella sp. HY328]
MVNPTTIEIRAESLGDSDHIRQVTQAAFKNNEHSNGTEGAIIDALRDANQLILSLVALSGDQIVGHIAFSPIRINGHDLGWYGLGPVAVEPSRHRQGIGTALINEGLAQLKALGGKGCVVAGDPQYYQRFGFQPCKTLSYEGLPAEYFMQLTLSGDTPTGRVDYHDSFNAS